jgi:hypothetical protein
MIYPFFYALIFLVSLVYTIAGFQKVRGKEPMKSRMDEMNHGGIVMKLIVLKHNFKERDIPAVLMIIVIGVALYLDPSFSILWNN